MKTLILASALLASFSSFAMKTTYDCGTAYGLPVTLTVATAQEGSLFDFTGAFSAPSRDMLTGTLIRSAKFTVIGDVETHDRKKFFVLTDASDAYHKVIVNVAKKLGQKVEVVDMDLTRKTEKSYKCAVVKLKK